MGIIARPMEWVLVVAEGRPDLTRQTRASERIVRTTKRVEPPSAGEAVEAQLGILCDITSTDHVQRSVRLRHNSSVIGNTASNRTGYSMDTRSLLYVGVWYPTASIRILAIGCQSVSNRVLIRSTTAVDFIREGMNLIDRFQKVHHRA